jgi:hypothetical protein
MEDLSRNDGEQSAYGYCLGNPIRYVDPSGFSYESYLGDWQYYVENEPDFWDQYERDLELAYSWPSNKVYIPGGTWGEVPAPDEWDDSTVVTFDGVGCMGQDEWGNNVWMNWAPGLEIKVYVFWNVCDGMVVGYSWYGSYCSYHQTGHKVPGYEGIKSIVVAVNPPGEYAQLSWSPRTIAVGELFVTSEVNFSRFSPLPFPAEVTGKDYTWVGAAFVNWDGTVVEEEYGAVDWSYADWVTILFDIIGARF